MFEALAAVMDYLFYERSFHRVSAGFVPRNLRSGRLLMKLGFRVEGYARDYLRINGQWEDHVLVAKLNENWAEP
jgi:ribosomal-protein-alanine N-acetyltransferase